MDLDERYSPPGDSDHDVRLGSPSEVVSETEVQSVQENGVAQGSDKTLSELVIQEPPSSPPPEDELYADVEALTDSSNDDDNEETLDEALERLEELIRS